MGDVVEGKLSRLRELLRGTGGAVVAFSGGADSALLLRVAHECLGARCVALTGVSPSLPAEEVEGARRVAAAIGARLVEVGTRETQDPRYLANAPDRCYFCKSELYDRALEWAAANGLPVVLDGLNADDDPADRPGVRAGLERGVRSPLREAGLTKAEVREASRRLGLETAEKPASPCLASRIPHGTPVTLERLDQVERAERGLRRLGFSELRVRHHGPVARVELAPADLPALLERRAEVVAAVRAAGFRFVTLDLEGLRSGGANRAAGPAAGAAR